MTDKHFIQKTAKTKEVWPTLAEAIEETAFKQADEFVTLGQTPKEAGSLVANMMIQTAWIVAGCGVIADGGVPNKDNFRLAVEDALSRIEFKAPEANAEGGAA